MGGLDPLQEGEFSTDKEIRYLQTGEEISSGQKLVLGDEISDSE